MSSCADKKQAGTSTNVIDIESSMQNITKLKVSDFGKTIRYIPLETTDDCLIGDKPIIKVLKNFIVIESNNNCFLFDKKDGSFISSIGHRGQDPEAYSSNFSYTDEKEEFLYFEQQPDKMIKYDMTGKFSGKITFPIQSSYMSRNYLFTDKEIIAYHFEIVNSNNYTLSFHDKTGVLKDTSILLLPKLDETINNIISISVIKSIDTYGCWSETGLLIIDYRDEKRQLSAVNPVMLWNHDGNIRFRENYIDTIYNINEGKLTPYIAFNTGKWNWPVNERLNKDNNDKRIFISYVAENSAFLFFQFITGLYTDKHIIYNGLYNKKTGETMIGKHSDGIQDDLSGFMPFKPKTMSSSGEFVSLVDAFTIMEWVENNPEAKNNTKLSFLKDFNDDMNPVILLVQ